MISLFSIPGTGLWAQQQVVDAIAHNMANLRTPGYKAVRASLQDLPYVQVSWERPSPDGATQEAINLGTGVSVSGIQHLFLQGPWEPTGSPTDLAIAGQGFFRLELPNGGFAYTRDGAFHADPSGRLVNSSGYPLAGVRLPVGAQDIAISPDGLVTALDPATGERMDAGRIELARFTSPDGLVAVGGGLFLESEASGQAILGIPGSDGMGTIVQGFLEGSNVELSEQFTQMIVAQRAYQLNLRALQALDEMVGMAANLRK
jgi:flagellar basal-body rod protein FlgG